MPKEKRQLGEGVPPNERPVNRTRRKRGNQWTTNPQQLDFIRYFLGDKTAPTYGNAYLSAIKAGYEESYASKITYDMPEWLQAWTRENISDDELVAICEQNLRNDVLMDVEQPIVTTLGLMRDKEGKLVKIRDSKLMKLKADQSNFALKALRPKKYVPPTKVVGEGDNGEVLHRILVD